MHPPASLQQEALAQGNKPQLLVTLAIVQCVSACQCACECARCETRRPKSLHAKLSSLDHQHTNNDQLGLNLGLLFFSTSSYNFKEPASFLIHILPHGLVTLFCTISLTSSVSGEIHIPRFFLLFLSPCPKIPPILLCLAIGH